MSIKGGQRYTISRVGLGVYSTEGVAGGSIDGFTFGLLENFGFPFQPGVLL